MSQDLLFAYQSDISVQTNIIIFYLRISIIVLNLITLFLIQLLWFFSEYSYTFVEQL